MHQQAEQAQLCSGNSEDKLSSLHESVLSRILSQLPTVEAVRTSVLSKTWRKMWTNVTDLRFDDRYRRDPRDNRFTDIVERVLNDMGSLHINSFHLRSVNSYDQTLLISWLSKVLRCNLQRLDITCYELETVNFSPFFDSMGSLVELRLRMKSILDISATARFPNLKFLSLEDARIFNKSSDSSNLVLNFPVLETFEASHCRCFGTESIILKSPLLRVFKMFKCNYEHVRDDFEGFKIRVVSSKLEKITFSEDDIHQFWLSFPPCLPDAYLSLRISWWPRDFLRSFTCVKRLGLELGNDVFLLKVPKFRHLVYLHLIYDMSQLSELREFLKSAPMLEMLTILDKASPDKIPSSGLLNRLRFERAPHCVRTMLKALVLRNFNARELQLSVLKYLMKNAEFLELVILCTPEPITEESKALVLSYPKASPHASVFLRDDQKKLTLLRP